MAGGALQDRVGGEFIGLRAEDADAHFARGIVRKGRARIGDGFFIDAGVGFLHGLAAELRFSVVNRAQEQRRDVLGVGVENHFAGHATITLQAVERIADAGAVQAGAAD